MVRVKITLIRHGESAFNRMQLVQGQMNPGLSPVGLTQAEKIGKRLENEKFDLVYTSDLKRAQQTAEKILRQNKVTKVAPIEDVRLREWNLGIWQGWPIPSMKGMLAQLRLPMEEFVPEEGESRWELRSRAVDFINDMCQQLALSQRERSVSPDTDKINILMVVHGFLIQELIAYFTENVSNQATTPVTNRVPNGSLSIFEADLKDAGCLSDVTCNSLYDASHL